MRGRGSPRELVRGQGKLLRQYAHPAFLPRVSPSEALLWGSTFSSGGHDPEDAVTKFISSTFRGYHGEEAMASWWQAGYVSSCYKNKLKSNTWYKGSYHSVIYNSWKLETISEHLSSALWSTHTIWYCWLLGIFLKSSLKCDKILSNKHKSNESSVFFFIPFCIFKIATLNMHYSYSTKAFLKSDILN